MCFQLACLQETSPISFFLTPPPLNTPLPMIFFLRYPFHPSQTLFHLKLLAWVSKEVFCQVGEGAEISHIFQGGGAFLRVSLNISPRRFMPLPQISCFTLEFFATLSFSEFNCFTAHAHTISYERTHTNSHTHTHTHTHTHAYKKSLREIAGKIKMGRGQQQDFSYICSPRKWEGKK